MSLGRHLFADFYLDEKNRPDSGEWGRIFWAAMQDLGLAPGSFTYNAGSDHHICTISTPDGIHLAAYIFFEKNYITVDIFTISGSVEPEILFEKLAGLLRPKMMSHEIIIRGAYLHAKQPKN